MKSENLLRDGGGRENQNQKTRCWKELQIRISRPIVESHLNLGPDFAP